MFACPGADLSDVELTDRAVELTVPGGPVPCAGVTVVGVLPTHRRRGILSALMRSQLANVRGRGEPLAALWASEETIYGRYGYGLASLDAMMRATRVHAALRPDLPQMGSVRLVGRDEAVGETDAMGLLAAHVGGGEHELQRALLSDHRSQRHRDPESLVEPEPGEVAAEPGLGAGDA